MRYTPFIITGLLILVTLPALGASSYLGGFSGAILTPDSVIVPHQTWEGSFHDTLLSGGNSDLTATGLTYGLLPNLEVGASYLTGGANRVAVSGKYRLVAENATTPGVTIGIFDATGSVSSTGGDASFYALLSKNITPLATDIYGRPSKPLRMSLGLGTGFYNGIIANLDWTLAPRFSLLAEYKGGNRGIDGNRASAGIRWAATDALRIDAAAVGFRDLGLGVSYRGRFH